MSARTWILGLAMTAVAGVATAGPKGAPAAAVEGPETIAYGVLRPGPLSAASSSRNIFLGGLVGALVDMSDGKQIVADNDLPDPAAPMARNLAFELADLRGVQVDDRSLDLERMKTRDIAIAGGPSRYVVGTITAGRSFMWQSLAWNRYRVYYTAVLNVVDTQTREIALAEICKWNSDKNGAPMPEGAPTRASLLDDKAALLKAIFDEAGQACQAQFSASLRRWASAPVAPTTVAAVSRAEPRLQSAPAQIASPAPPVLQAEQRPAEPVFAVPVYTPAPEPVPAPMVLAQAQPPQPPVAVERYPAFDHRLAAAYPEPTASPAFAVRGPDYRAAGRDAAGFLVWPGKRP